MRNSRTPPSRRGDLVVVADQAAYSLGNFTISVVVASTATAGEFGRFSIAFLVTSLAIVAVRGLGGELVLSARSNDQSPAALRYVAAGAGTWLATCLLAALLWSANASILVAIGLAGVAAMAQDLGRYAAISRGRPTHALLSDLVWLGGQVAAWLLLGPVADTATRGIAAWSIGALLGAIVVCPGIICITRDRGRGAASEVGRHARGQVVDNFVAAAAAPIAMSLVGVVADSGIAGVLRSAQLVFNPVAVVAHGVRSVEVHRLASSPSGPGSRAHVRGVLLLTTAWTVTAIVVPDSIGSAVLGDLWYEAEPLLLPVGLARLCSVAALDASIRLRGAGHGWSAVGPRLVTTVAVIAAITFGVVGGSASRAAWLDAAANAAVVPVWIRAARRQPALRTPGPSDARIV